MSLFKNLSNIFVEFRLQKCFCETKKYIRRVRKVSKTQLIWYPGHINKGIEVLHQKLGNADAIIEIHDCRIPLSGRTEILHTFGKVKPKILILNKVDLIQKSDIKRIEKRLRANLLDEDGQSNNIIFSNLNDYGNQNKLFEKITDILHNELKIYNSTKPEHYILVSGIPNVGKSSFINGLRNWNTATYGYSKSRSVKPASVGPHAGVTRTVSHKILISDGPPRLYVLDSPGIWEPRKENLESVLKMALCGCLNFDSLFKEIVIDYLLYWLNQNGQLKYVERYGLSGPTDDVVELALRVCALRGFVSRANERQFGQKYAPNIELAFEEVMRDFSRGDLGRFVIDNLEEQEQDGGEQSAVLFRNRNSLPLGTIIKSSASSRKNFPFIWGTE